MDEIDKEKPRHRKMAVQKMADIVSAVLTIRRFVQRKKEMKAEENIIQGHKNRRYKYLGQTVLHKEISRSNRALMQASFGRRVITLNEVAARIVDEERRRRKQQSQLLKAQNVSRIQEDSFQSSFASTDIQEELKKFHANKLVGPNTYPNLIEKIRNLGRSNLRPVLKKSGTKLAGARDSQIIDLTSIIVKNNRIASTIDNKGEAKCK